MCSACNQESLIILCHISGLKTPLWTCYTCDLPVRNTRLAQVLKRIPEKLLMLSSSQNGLGGFALVFVLSSWSLDMEHSTCLFGFQIGQAMETVVFQVVSLICRKLEILY